MELNEHVNYQNNFNRQLRIIEVKIICCVGLAFSCLYGIGIVIFSKLVSENILLTIAIYILFLLFFSILVTIFSKLCYPSRLVNTHQWYEILQLDEINEYLKRQHTLIPKDNNSKLEYNIETGTINESKCPICLDNLTIEKNIIKLSCKHEFCIECIAIWCQKKNSCPMCKTSIINKN